MTRLRMESGTNEPRRAFRFGALDLVSFYPGSV
jgi:hypothetical protein